MQGRPDPTDDQHGRQQQHHQPVIVKGYGDVAGDGVDDVYVVFVIVFAGKLLREQNHAHQFAARHHRHGRMRAQAFEDIAVAIDELRQTILLGLQIQRLGLSGQLFDIFVNECDLFADGFL